MLSIIYVRYDHCGSLVVILMMMMMMMVVVVVVVVVVMKMIVVAAVLWASTSRPRAISCIHTRGERATQSQPSVFLRFFFTSCWTTRDSRHCGSQFQSRA
jgi:hypothetical protein